MRRLLKVIVFACIAFGCIALGYFARDMAFRVDIGLKQWLPHDWIACFSSVELSTLRWHSNPMVRDLKRQYETTNDLQIKRDIIEQLGTINTVASMDILAGIFADTHAENSLRIVSAWALARRQIDDGRDFLKEQMNNKNLKLNDKWLVAYALCCLGDGTYVIDELFRQAEEDDSLSFAILCRLTEIYLDCHFNEDDNQAVRSALQGVLKLPLSEREKSVLSTLKEYWQKNEHKKTQVAFL